MIDIEKNVSLKALNTFGIRAEASYLCHVRSEDDLRELIQSDIYQNEPHYVLAGGSNILFTGDFKGLIIKVDLKGIEINREDDDEVVLNVAAGENWHQLVMHVVGHQWGGIENLSLIPGTVGAAPMQNIGAYGVEIKNVVEKVEAIDLSSGGSRTFNNAECEFGYRESVFKTTLRKKFFISSVTLRLTKKNHQLNVEYGAIRNTLAANKVNTPSIKNI
ncbi:MAG: FAD-binding protein, partial [Cyclobacteriaceae bacterium]|nr:FAD-binding protein [Cyclobacteriaceae bacterium]